MILYISDRKIWEKQAVKQLGWVLFFGLLGAVYERFSHEVYSYYMIYGFAVPLVLGVLPYSVMALGEHRLPGEMALKKRFISRMALDIRTAWKLSPYFCP